MGMEQERLLETGSLEQLGLCGKVAASVILGAEWRDVRNTHVEVLAEKPCNLPPASWRPRKSRGAAPVHARRLRARDADLQGQEKMPVPGKQKAGHPACTLFLSAHSTGWMPPTTEVKTVLFTLTVSQKANFFQKLILRHKQRVLPAVLVSLSPVDLTPKIILHGDM